MMEIWCFTEDQVLYGVPTLMVDKVHMSLTEPRMLVIFAS